MKNFLKLLLGTGLLILDHPDRAKKAVVDGAGDRLNDLRDLAQDKCESIASGLSSAFRHNEENRYLRNTAGLLAGLGVGVGLGMLFAPASGKQTRSRLSAKVEEFAGEVQERWKSNPLSAAHIGD